MSRKSRKRPRESVESVTMELEPGRSTVVCDACAHVLQCDGNDVGGLACWKSNSTVSGLR